MDCIQLMIEEHKYIKRMLAVIRKYCYKVLKNQPVQYEDFFKMIDFVRNYADKHHHGKEEDLLFNRMMEEQGSAAEKLVRLGMLVEHDLGRLHMQELEEAVRRVMDGDDQAKLDVIANAISYTHLLHRHIDKEDNVVYKFAERGLSKETVDKINAECINFESAAKAKGVQDRYLDLLKDFEANV
ncbi:MAG: hemerythrin domain-containing protein [Clostridia bacterium]